MINLKSLNTYLSLYTNIKIEHIGNNLHIGNTTIEASNKFSAMIIYGEAIKYLIHKNTLDTVQVFYLQDLITMYLKEIAKANGIDPNQYRWSSDLIKQYPEYGLFYNTIEGFKYRIQLLSNGGTVNNENFPIDFLTNIIDNNFNNYIIVKGNTSSKSINEYSKSLDDII